MRFRGRLILIILLLGAVVVSLSYCTGVNPDEVSIEAFAERETCVKCHKDISESYLQTAHYHTSAAFSESMLDSAMAHPDFHFSDSLSVSVEKRDGNYVQTARNRGKQTDSRPFDVVFGSGEKAMTFAWYADTGVYQLPLTYYTKIGRWVNSPGFPDQPHYKRAVITGCLECHSSYAKTVKKQEGKLAITDHVVKGSIAFGIDCQRCHGPGAKHAAFHETNPGVKPAQYMTRIRQLSRQQRLDNCAVCHSGSDEATQRSLFGFVPGDTLKNFYYPYNNSKQEPDVHGNQYQMLARSACFIKSEMDCSSCHNTHRSEPASLAVFSQKCISCHQDIKHPGLGKPCEVLNANCIDCHMPLQPSRLISFQESGKLKTIPYELRNHQIGVYKTDGRKILSYLRSL